MKVSQSGDLRPTLSFIVYGYHQMLSASLHVLCKGVLLTYPDLDGQGVNEGGVSKGEDKEEIAIVRM